MDAWQRSHQVWWHEQDISLQKLNRSRGFTNEGTSLADNDELTKNIPYELRRLLGPAPQQDVTTTPSSSDFQKMQTLDNLTGDAPTLKKSETEFEAWFHKALAESQSPFLADRLPTRDAPLAKGEVQSRMRSLLGKLRSNAAAAGVAVDTSLMEKAIAALDMSAFAELVERAVEKIDAARAMAA